MSAVEQVLIAFADILGLACIVSGTVTVWRARNLPRLVFLAAMAISAGGTCVRLAQIIRDDVAAARAMELGSVLVPLTLVCLGLLIATAPAALGRARALQGYAR